MNVQNISKYHAFPIGEFDVCIARNIWTMLWLYRLANSFQFKTISLETLGKVAFYTITFSVSNLP